MFFKVITMQSGDAAVIPAGTEFQHRPEVISDKVVLLLIEPDDRTPIR